MELAPTFGPQTPLIIFQHDGKKGTPEDLSPSSGGASDRGGGDAAPAYAELAVNASCIAAEDGGLSFNDPFVDGIFHDKHTIFGVR